DRERRVRGKARDPCQDPEELVLGHGLSHHACAWAAQKAVAMPGPRRSALLAAISASQAVAATTDTSSSPLLDGRPVRGSMRWCTAPHLRLRTLLVAAPWSRSIRVWPPNPTGHPPPAGPRPAGGRSPPRCSHGFLTGRAAK